MVPPQLGVPVGGTSFVGSSSNSPGATRRTRLRPGFVSMCLPILAVVLILGAASPSRAQGVADPAAVVGPSALGREAIARALATADRPDAPAAGAEGQTPAPGAPAWAAEGRACPGCPQRRVWAPYLQATIINVFYNLGNLARGEETAKIGLNSWWDNMSFGFEWDENPFLVNQFGHPYQGNNYYTAGRANGLSFWESTTVAAFGSATWEYFGENNHASFNDFINTTLGGIALGEIFHRTAWLIRDTTASGKGRLWGEIGAMVVDPLTGANRFISGDRSRVSEKPETYVPARKEAFGSFGLLWQGNNDNAFTESPKVFLDADLRYGDYGSGRSRTPYEAFTVEFRFGGGQAISDVRVRGRMLGEPLGEQGRLQLTLSQSYDFVANPAYNFGRQGFDLTVHRIGQLGSRMRMAIVGGAGVTVLSAVDSVLAVEPVDVVEELSEEEEGEEADRDYDYGPGTTFGGGFRIDRDAFTIVNVSYQGYQTYVVDGIRANHVLQRFRFDVLVPIRRTWGVGVAAEYFYRKTYFQAGGERNDKFPQVRIFFAWRS